jgi:hypothetical protein
MDTTVAEGGHGPGSPFRLRRWRSGGGRRRAGVCPWMCRSCFCFLVAVSKNASTTSPERVASAVKPVGADATAEDMGRAPRARLPHLSPCTQEPATPTPYLHHLAPMAWLDCRCARAGHRLRRGIPRGVAPQDNVHGRRHRRARTTLRVAASGSPSRASSTRPSPCAAAEDGACRAEHRAPPREMGLAVPDTERCCGRPGCRSPCTPREAGAVQASLASRDAGPAGYCVVAAAMGLLFVAGLPSPD